MLHACQTHIHRVTINNCTIEYTWRKLNALIQFILQKRKTERYSRRFCNPARSFFLSDTLLLHTSLYIIDKLIIFSQQVSHNSNTPECSESVFAFIDLFPFFFFSRFSSSFFFLLFHRHHSHAHIFFFYAERLSIVLVFPFSCEQRTRWRMKNRSHVHGDLHIQ